MQITCFGITRDIAGKDVITIDGDQVKTISDLKKMLFLTYPEMKALKSLSIAINEEYAEDNDSINEGDDIVLIPPVSGG